MPSKLPITNNATKSDLGENVQPLNKHKIDKYFQHFEQMAQV